MVRKMRAYVSDELTVSPNSRRVRQVGRRDELLELLFCVSHTSDGATQSSPAELRCRCVEYREKTMRTIAYALALALGVAFATSAFAQDVSAAKTKADCDKAGGMWDTATSTCKAKQ